MSTTIEVVRSDGSLRYAASVAEAIELRDALGGAISEDPPEYVECCRCACFVGPDDATLDRIEGTFECAVCEWEADNAV